MKDLKKMMGKDDEGGDMKKEAKLSVLKELRELASKMMGDDLKNGMDSMKKVTVASDSKEGLKRGLEKAEEMMDVGPEGQSEEAEMTDELEGEMSPEELDAEIARLQSLKSKMSR